MVPTFTNGSPPTVAFITVDFSTVSPLEYNANLLSDAKLTDSPVILSSSLPLSEYVWIDIGKPLTDDLKDNKLSSISVHPCMLIIDINIIKIIFTYFPI